MIMQILTSPVPCTMFEDGPEFRFHFKIICSKVLKSRLLFFFFVHRVNKGYLVNLEFQVKEVTKEHKVIKDHVESLA